MLQKKAIRIVSFAKYHDHTKPLFKNLNCMNLYDIVYFKTQILMYKIKQNSVPLNIRQHFSVNICHNFSTRSKQKGSFVVKYCRTKAKSFTVSIIGVKNWNLLASELTCACSINVFKRKLKKQIFSKYV